MRLAPVPAAGIPAATLVGGDAGDDGVGTLVAGLMVGWLVPGDNALNQLYQANFTRALTMRTSSLLITPWLLLLGVAMSGVDGLL